MQLTGPNGSGKSSLLRLIAGLNEAAAGTLVLAGGDSDLTIGQQAHYIAHQEAVKTALTVDENLAFWRDFLGGGERRGRPRGLRPVTLSHPIRPDCSRPGRSVDSRWRASC